MYYATLLFAELSYREIIIALPTLTIIAVVFGVICMQRRKKKNKKINMEYMHFEVSRSINYV